MKKYDLFIFAAEDSADLHGYNLLSELKKTLNLKILSVSGPRMRKHETDIFLKMEDFHVMGLTDIIFSLPRMLKLFFKLRKKLLTENPKVIIFIDYPDFTMLLEKSLRKKGFKNQIIHYIAPTVWAWRKNRMFALEKNVDVLMSIFPFEKAYFSKTKLDVRYIGHPLYDISLEKNEHSRDLIGIFPGSRRNEILRNFTYQVHAMKELLKIDQNLKFAISNNFSSFIEAELKKNNINTKNIIFFPFEENYTFMKKMKFAIATSGTINLELALHKVPTVVNFKIKKIDLFLGKYILKINLPFYCIVNIILQKEIFFELYGPHLTFANIAKCSKQLLFEKTYYQNALEGCENLTQILKSENANKNAAAIIFEKLKYTQDTNKKNINN